MDFFSVVLATLTAASALPLPFKGDRVRMLCV